MFNRLSRKRDQKEGQEKYVKKRAENLPGL